jgi:NADPH2:quinone reductase
VCEELGPPEKLRLVDEAPLVAGPGQVVVDVRAAGVNFVDGLFVQGKYQIKPPLPFTPGSEIAGVVASVGDGVDGWAVGDRVFAVCGLGGYAEQVALHALSLRRIPDSMSFGQAASFVQSYGTALFAMTRRTTLSEGETVLVLGAGGGVGIATVDVACALGARVIAAASSDAKLEAARARGASDVINYERDDIKTRARELSDGGVDMVVDPVGGAHSEPALRALRFGGRFLVIGFAAGPIPAVPLNQVLLNNRTVVGVDWGAWTMRDSAGNGALLDEIIAMIDAGRLSPPEPTTYPLADTSRALDDLLERRATGKSVLVP